MTKVARIALLFAAGAAVIAASPVLAQAMDGASLFAKHCGTCHLDPRAGNGERRIGPNLNGVVGHKAGVDANYQRYSSALRASGRVWTDAALDAYLAAPMTALPGTTMALVASTSPAERAALIAHLKAAR